jgi:hypothetical protein
MAFSATRFPRDMITGIQSGLEMRLSVAAVRLAIVFSTLGMTPSQTELWGQQEVPADRMPEPYRRLQKLGDLRLKTNSIHGLAPLVVLFTEAPVSASKMERRYRQQLTSMLMWNIERLGVSLFSLQPTSQSVDSLTVDQMKRKASAASQILRILPPGDQPQVFIGFADGAVAAARLLLRDSLSAALVALVPSTPADSSAAAQEELWEELLYQSAYPRPVLVLESMCNSATSGLTRITYRRRQTILVLPQYDAWLSQRNSSACPSIPTRTVGMDYELISIVIEWLRRTVTFRT